LGEYKNIDLYIFVRTLDHLILEEVDDKNFLIQCLANPSTVWDLFWNSGELWYSPFVLIGVSLRL